MASGTRHGALHRVSGASGRSANSELRANSSYARSNRACSAGTCQDSPSEAAASARAAARTSLGARIGTARGNSQAAGARRYAGIASGSCAACCRGSASGPCNACCASRHAADVLTNHKFCGKFVERYIVASATLIYWLNS